MSDTQTPPYVPTDLEIEDVSFQVPDTVSRDTIIDTLIKNKGDVTEAILTILTNDNVVPKNNSPKRITVVNEIKEWNDFYKTFDKYNIENNIERVKETK